MLIWNIYQKIMHVINTIVTNHNKIKICIHFKSCSTLWTLDALMLGLWTQHYFIYIYVFATQLWCPSTAVRNPTAVKCACSWIITLIISHCFIVDVINLFNKFSFVNLDSRVWWIFLVQRKRRGLCELLPQNPTSCYALPPSTTFSTIARVYRVTSERKFCTCLFKNPNCYFIEIKLEFAKCEVGKNPAYKLKLTFFTLN